MKQIYIIFILNACCFQSICQVNPPTKVEASEGFEDRIEVTWKEPDLDNGYTYRVWRGNSNEFNDKTCIDVTKECFEKPEKKEPILSDYTAESEKAYYYFIQAHYKGQWSKVSKPDRGYRPRKRLVLTPIPYAPALNSRISTPFEWSPIEGATAYEIQIATTNEGWSLIDGFPKQGQPLVLDTFLVSTSLNIPIKGLYFWCVKALTTDSVSYFSRPQQVVFVEEQFSYSLPEEIPFGLSFKKVTLTGNNLKAQINIQSTKVLKELYFYIYLSQDNKFDNSDVLIHQEPRYCIALQNSMFLDMKLKWQSAARYMLIVPYFKNRNSSFLRAIPIK